MSKKKVGILGGSFDPVHFGHLNLSISLKETCMLNEVWLVPAGLSPFKQETPPSVSSEHRLAMLKLATSHIPGFRILTDEIERNGPSYTIDTVRKLSEDKSLQLHLLLGDDQVPHFHLWKDAEELATLAPLLIGTRENLEGTLGKRIKIPIFEVSSTLVRQRLKNKLYCGHLVPASVLDYIAQHHLY